MIGKISIATTFFLCCLGYFSYAQFTSPDGYFSVNAIRGCAAPLNITISAPQCDAAGTIGCDIRIDRGTPLTFKHGIQNNTVSFSTPGIHEIIFQEGGDEPDTMNIEVFPNTPPVFDVFLCTGNQITVKLNDVAYDDYVINFNDASPTVTAAPGSTQNHTYTPGNHTVSIRGRKTNAVDNCITQNKPVTVGPFIAPAIDEISVNKTDLQFAFSGLQSYYLTKLEVATNNGTSFQQLTQSVATPTLTVSSLRPDLNYYCFRLALLSGCNNTVQVRSGTLCSIKLDATAANNQNNLAWSTYTPVVSGYLLDRNGAAIPPPAAGSLSYTDTDVTCKENYRYQLTAMSGAGRSISNLDSAIAFSTDVPATVNNITAIVGQDGVQLQWEPVTGFTPKTFEVFKTENGESFSVGSTSELQINDPNYTTISQICYYILYEDVCDNQSQPSNEACPIRLTYTLQNDNEISLAWSAYTGWQSNVAFYTVERFDAAGQSLGAPVNVGTSLSYIDLDEDPDNQVFQYVIKANSNDGLPQAVSNRIIVIKSANIYHPTAFTPDGQGPEKNNTFRVWGRYVASFELQIYTRWGEPMFITNDIEAGWDGTFRGNPMPEGTYTFVATITDLAGRTFKRSGNVILLRKNK